jgi:predicted enzyme related to lactoylglutathione lyase
MGGGGPGAHALILLERGGPIIGRYCAGCEQSRVALGGSCAGRAVPPKADLIPREGAGARCSVYGVDMEKSPLALIEFPADNPERARRFWTRLLGGSLESRTAEEGEGWQTRSTSPAVGVHTRGPGPGDSFSLPYFEVPDLSAALAQVQDLGGTVIHPGDRWAICKDSEGSPFGLLAWPLTKSVEFRGLREPLP